MLLRSLSQVRQSVGFRLILWYSGIFVVSSVFLFALAYFLLLSSLRKQDHETIDLELQELFISYQAGGIQSLKKDIGIGKRFGNNAPFFVRLAGPKNKTLIFSSPSGFQRRDLRHLERMSLTESTFWIYLPVHRNRYLLEIACLRLNDEYLLQVGKSTEERQTILRRFREIFGAVSVPMILSGLAAGSFLAFRALRPVRDLIDTVRSISVGKMDARVPYPQSGNEFDELARLFNGMIGRIENLIRGMRDSLDNVAHDLRTPIARLRGIAELALQSDQNVEVCQEALANCQEESERILTMLNTLMDVAEAETGTIKLDQRSVNVSDVIGDVVEVYRYIAEDKGIALNTSCSKDLFLTVDPGRIRQILANLLDNAIKYTPKNGRVDIEAHRAEKQIDIVVKDTGIGIAPDEHQKIWDRLYRGDQSRSERGLGLGLSLVKAIVEAHKGRVTVESEPGKGSTFVLSLPSTS